MFLGDWANSTANEILMDFVDYPKKDNYVASDDIEILLAYYLYEDYSGRAFVLFKQNGKLYEVNGSHCSCYGLEGQWDPEETTVEALQHRLAAGYFGTEYSGYDKYTNTFGNQLKQILETL